MEWGWIKLVISDVGVEEATPLRFSEVVESFSVSECVSLTRSVFMTESDDRNFIYICFI